MSKEFDESVDRLAQRIGQDALDDSCDLSVRLDCLRVLIAYGEKIVSKREATDDDDGVFTFTRARKQVEQADEAAA